MSIEGIPSDSTYVENKSRNSQKRLNPEDFYRKPTTEDIRNAMRGDEQPVDIEALEAQYERYMDKLNLNKDKTLSMLKPPQTGLDVKSEEKPKSTGLGMFSGLTNYKNQGLMQMIHRIEESTGRPAVELREHLHQIENENKLRDKNVNSQIEFYF